MARNSSKVKCVDCGQIVSSLGFARHRAKHRDENRIFDEIKQLLFVEHDVDVIVNILRSKFQIKKNK